MNNRSKVIARHIIDQMPWTMQERRKAIAKLVDPLTPELVARLFEEVKAGHQKYGNYGRLKDEKAKVRMVPPDSPGDAPGPGGHV